MADDKRYKRNITTVHGDKETVTEHEPKVTTRTEQQVNGFYNPDGTPNEAARQAFEEQKRQIAPAYHVNPDTGEVDRRMFLSDMFPGLETMREQREAEEALNRRKQKESAWYNGLSVLGDMITTATGGNVWQRQADQHAKAAHDTNIALQREQAAEDNAAAQAVNSTKAAYANAVQKLYDSVGKAYGTKVSYTTEQGGKTTTRTKQGNDRTYGEVGGRAGGSSSSSSSSSSGGGGKNTDYIAIRVPNAPGGEKYMTFEIPKTKKDALSRVVARSVEDAVRNGDKNAERLWTLYFTPGSPGTPAKRGQAGKAPTPDRWNYDGLINDGTLYAIPGMMDIYLNELEKMHLTHTVDGKEKEYTRDELETLMTGGNGPQAPWLQNQRQANTAPWVQ